MKRRTFTLAAALAATPASFLAALPARAQGNGQGYKTLSPPASVDVPSGKIEVVEFFSYVCPHCMHFEPAFEKWKTTVPKYVVVRRMHVGFNKSFEPFQRIYFALEALNAPDTVHTQVFAAEQNQHLNLDQPEVLFPWVAQHGIDRAKFEQAYKSFGVDSQIRRADALQEAYKVEGTPALGIGGKFYTDPTYIQGGNTEENAFTALLNITDGLIEQIRRGK